MSFIAEVIGEKIERKTIDKFTKGRRCKVLKTIVNDIDKIQETNPTGDLSDDVSDLRERAVELQKEFGCKEIKKKRFDVKIK